MLRGVFLSLVVLSMLVPGVSSATEEGISRKPALFGYAGYGGLAPEDLNHAIDEDERLLQGYGFPIKWGRFGGAFDFGAGLVWRVNEMLGLGIDGGIQTARTDSRYSDRTGSFRSIMKLRIVEVRGQLELWVPYLPNFLVGLHVGMGFSVFQNEVQFTDNNYAPNSFEVEERFDGSGRTAGAFLGYRVPYGTGGQLLARAGYRFRNLGPMESEFGPAVDNTGQPIEFDYSGIYGMLALGFNLF